MFFDPNQIKPHSDEMLYTKDEQTYQKSYNMCMQLTAKSEIIMSQPRDLNSNKNKLLKYLIHKHKGSMLEQTSTCTEQNHSTMISYIGKNYCGELHELFQMLMMRHIKLILEQNTEIVKAHMLQIQIAKKIRDTYANKSRILYGKHICKHKATLALTKFAYNKFCLVIDKSESYFNKNYQVRPSKSTKK